MLKRAFTKEEVEAKYQEFYGKEPLIKITKDIPEVRDAMKKHHVTIGGFEVDPKTRRVVTVTTLDNLLKGAATQAIQNLNLALGVEDELEGIRKEL
jgi:N-acetyl-gamma-glutamylphosphate reductase